MWLLAINQAARDRGLTIMLTGQKGNMTISYSGLELLPELLKRGQLLRLMLESVALVRNGSMRVRGVAGNIAGPFLPGAVWQWASERFRGYRHDLLEYTAIRPDQLQELDLHDRAQARGLDLAYRPRVDGFDARMWILRRGDNGNINKGMLAGWGIDIRDPTADKRLVEFCLSVPMEQFLASGIPRALGRRALSDRLPQAVLKARAKGYQAADWYEGFSTARDAVAEEVTRLKNCGAADNVLDLERMIALVEDWPKSGWSSQRVMRRYRLALMRGIAAGHFLRKASGSNA